MNELEKLIGRAESSVTELGECLKDRGWFIGTAESCTGGWIAQMLTAGAGSSSWFESSIVTYSNAAKINLEASGHFDAISKVIKDTMAIVVKPSRSGIRFSTEISI